MHQSVSMICPNTLELDSVKNTSLSDSCKNMSAGSEVTTTYISSAYMFMYDQRDSFVQL